jgi:putative transposase
MARALREITGRYAQYRNALDATSGHVWQNRYYSCPFETSRLAAVMRYVELNPVRAGLARDPGDYSWSSAVSHLGGTDAAGLLDLGAWFRDWTADGWAAVLREGLEESVAIIRQATHAGRPWGNAAFLVSLERQLSRRLSPGRPGRPKLNSPSRAAN